MEQPRGQKRTGGTPQAGGGIEDFRAGQRGSVDPPVTSALPFCKSVVVCPERAMLRGPVFSKVLAAWTAVSTLMMSKPASKSRLLSDA